MMKTFVTQISSRWNEWPIHTGIVLLLLAAFILRVVGVWADWPFGFLHIDEGFHVRNTTQLVMNREIAPDNLIYPTGYPFTLTIPVGITVIIGFVFGFFSSLDELVAKFLLEPGFIYVGIRVWTALLGALTVGLVYQAGQSAYGRRAGLIGALLLTVSLLHVEISHLALPEVQVGFLVIASLLFCLKFVDSLRLRDFLIASALFGLAVSTKQSALPLALVLIATWVMTRKSVAHDRRWIQYAFAGSVVTVVVFIATSPVYLTEFSSAFSENIGSGGENGFSKLATGKIGLFDGPDYLWTFQMWLMEDWALAALAIAGAVFAVLVRNKSDILLGLFALGFFGIAATLAVHQVHYVIPVLPVMFVFGGRLADRALTRAQMTGITLHRSVVLLLVLAFVLSSARSIALDIGLTGMDTRLMARQWVHANIEAGSTIAITNVIYGAPLHDPDDRRFNGRTKAESQTADSTIADYLAATVTYSTTEQLSNSDGLLIPPEQWLIEGWDYVIVSSFNTDQFLVNEPPPKNNPLFPDYELGRAHYLSLAESPYIIEVSAFNPSLRHPGPHLVIYQVLDPA
jgi:hypothetical protein